MFCCALCRSSEMDESLYGEVLGEEIKVHTFCLYLTPNLFQTGEEDEGILGFSLNDISKESRRISQLNCCYCSKRYANIGCCNIKCRHSFHLICGIKNGAENQFADTYNSYCNRHVRNRSCRAPKLTEKCCICYENLRKNKQSFNALNMVQAPCCKNGWFHKICLQKFAKTSGYFFKCPLCNDKKIFCERLPYSGIFIYDRDAAWELEPNAFNDQLERPNSCAANICQCLAGREKTNTRNPLLLCRGCGSIAMHKNCLPAIIRGNHFYCNDCSIFQENKCDILCLKKSQDYDSEDDDVDVCNDSDNDDLLDRSKSTTTIIIASSNEELFLRSNSVQKINRMYDAESTCTPSIIIASSNGMQRINRIYDDSDSEYSDSQWISGTNTKTRQELKAVDDVEHNSKVELIDITCRDKHELKNDSKEDIEDFYDMAQSSNAIRRNSCQNSSDEKQINTTISDEDDCLTIQKSSTVLKRYKIYDETFSASDESDISSDDFPNFQNFNVDVKPDKSIDKKPFTAIGPTQSSNKYLQNITNDVGSCNTSLTNKSCIAYRTRLKSVYKDSARPSCSSTRSTNSSSPTTSCIANRTRRKSLYRESVNDEIAVNSVSQRIRQDSRTETLRAQRTRRRSISQQSCLNNANVRRLRKRQFKTHTAVDVKEKVQTQATATSSSDTASDNQFESFSTTASTASTPLKSCTSSITTKSSYKSLESTSASMSDNEASTTAQSNCSIPRKRVKVLVKRVCYSSSSRKLTSSKHIRSSTDNEDCLKSKRTASPNRLLRNTRAENAKCPMRWKQNNILPYLTPSFKRIEGSLKIEQPTNVIDLYD